jgi:hypothetical protein
MRVGLVLNCAVDKKMCASYLYYITTHGNYTLDEHLGAFIFSGPWIIRTAEHYHISSLRLRPSGY